MRYDHQAGWKRPYLEAMGPRLTEVRLARGLSRRRLAALSGVDPTQIAYIEWGRHAPRRATLAPIAAALGMDGATLAAVLTGSIPDPLTVPVVTP